MKSKIKWFKEILENPIFDTIANLLKKFKSSKSYWSVSYLILIFTIREAIAWKYGSSIKIFMDKQIDESSISWLWNILGFVFDIGGNFELVILGLILFLILSFAKISENKNTSISFFYTALATFIFVSLLLLYYVKEYKNNDISVTVDIVTTTGYSSIIENEGYYSLTKKNNLSDIKFNDNKEFGLPTFDIKLVNNSNDTIFISKIIFDEINSTINNTIPKIYITKFYHDITFINDGWTTAQNVILTGNLFIDNSDSVPIKLNIGDIKERKTIKIPTFNLFQQRKVNQLIFNGEINYSFFNKKFILKKGKTKINFSINSFPEFHEEVPIRLSSYNILLKENNNNYKISRNISQAIKSNEFDRFTLVIGANRPSYHQFKATLIYNNNKKLDLGRYKLDFNLPRSRPIWGPIPLKL